MDVGLNFVDRGRGDPALVFVHGFTCGLSDWSEQMEGLSANNRCVAVDLPGHGASRAPGEATIATLAGAVNALLDSLGVDRAVLVGHSMGCRIVSETYSQSPRRVRGIVYIDGSLLAPADPDAAVERAGEAIERSGMRKLVARLYDGFFVAGTPAAVRARVNARLPAIDMDFARRLWLDLIRWDAARARAVLALVNVPVLVIQSTFLDTDLQRVSLLPGQTAPWMGEVASRVREATMAVVPGVGHFPMLEAPQRTNDAIAAFVGRLS